MRSVSATQGGSNSPNGRASCFGLIVQRLGPMTVDHEMRFRLPLRPPRIKLPTQYQKIQVLVCCFDNKNGRVALLVKAAFL